jgi:hypothetical protein
VVLDPSRRLVLLGGRIVSRAGIVGRGRWVRCRLIGRSRTSDREQTAAYDRPQGYEFLHLNHLHIQ